MAAPDDPLPAGQSLRGSGLGVPVIILILFAIISVTTYRKYRTEAAARAAERQVQTK